MDLMEQRVYAFGTIFLLANKMQSLGDKMDAKLTVKQWMFLAGVLRCGTDAPTLSQVAAHIGSSRQNVKKIAVLLEKQGFLVMERDEADARMLRIYLTEACFSHLRQRQKMEHSFLEELFDGFGPDELSSLADAIGMLERNVNEMGQGSDKEV